MEGNGSFRVESKITGRSGVLGLQKEEGAEAVHSMWGKKNIALGDKKNYSGTCSLYLPTL